MRGTLGSVVVLALVVAGGAARGGTLEERPRRPPRVVRDPGWHSQSVWRQPQGLPQNTVVDLLQTRDGYLWVGTKGGVARFDGVRFTVFDDSDKSQLRENEVWALAEGHDGSVWIATYGGGVSRYHDGKFTLYTVADGLASDYATALLGTGGGEMWIGTDRGISRFRDGKFETLSAPQGLVNEAVRSLFRDRDGSRDGAVWVGTVKGGISVFRNGRFETPTFTGEAPTAQVSGMFRDVRGALWLATSDGLFRLRDGRLTRYSTTDGLSANRVRRVLEGPKGSLWIVTMNGLDRVSRPDQETVQIDNMIALTSLSCGLIDREGSLWVGSLNAGLTRLGQGHFTTYTSADGLADDYVSTVLEDVNGNVWVGTHGGLMRFVDGVFTSYAGRSGLASRIVYSMAQDRAGHLWVGTEQGVFRSNVKQSCTAARCEPLFTPLVAPGLPPLNARTLLEDRSGAIWIGLHQDGLVRVENGRAKHFTAEDGLPSPFVRALVEDKEGALWIGTRGGGLARYKDGRFTVITEKDGLINDGIQALYLDREDTLWIATRQGVSRLHDGKFTSYTAADGLYSNFVYSFIEDGRGYLWMTCAKGIFRVSQRELADFAAGKLTSVVSNTYGLEHGLASTVAVVGHHPASFRTSDGRLWFGTHGGVSIVDPRRLEGNPLAPPVHIEAVSVDGRPLLLGSLLQSSPGRGDLEIHYAGLSFLAPEKVRFRYRLQGYDPDWIDVGNRRVAYYTNIPPGRYRFQVRGCNNDGLWNEAGAGFEIDLAPHFYQTIWFYGLCLAAVAVAGAWTQRWRVARLQHRERQLSQRVEESLAQIKVLRGLLPICASCKKIRDDKGYWSQMETYIHQHSQAEFSHSICPDCMNKLYPNYLGGTDREGLG